MNDTLRIKWIGIGPWLGLLVVCAGCGQTEPSANTAQVVSTRPADEHSLRFVGDEKCQLFVADGYWIRLKKSGGLEDVEVEIELRATRPLPPPAEGHDLMRTCNITSGFQNFQTKSGSCDMRNTKAHMHVTDGIGSFLRRLSDEDRKRCLAMNPMFSGIFVVRPVVTGDDGSLVILDEPRVVATYCIPLTYDGEWGNPPGREVDD